MANRLTKGLGLFANIKFPSGTAVRTVSATVARTDTSAKTLFSLPAGTTITAIRVASATGSDAGTTATLSVGKVGGTGAEYINAMSVKGAGTTGQQVPSTGILGSVGAAAVTVTGTYAETGTAGTTGGPWVIYVDHIVA